MEKTEELPNRNFQFSLRALFIWVTLAAVLIWLFRDHPVVCVGIAILAFGGIVRTCINVLQN